MRGREERRSRNALQYLEVAKSGRNDSCFTATSFATSKPVNLAIFRSQETLYAICTMKVVFLAFQIFRITNLSPSLSCTRFIGKERDSVHIHTYVSCTDCFRTLATLDTSFCDIQSLHSSLTKFVYNSKHFLEFLIAKAIKMDSTQLQQRQKSLTTIQCHDHSMSYSSPACAPETMNSKREPFPAVCQICPTSQ